MSEEVHHHHDHRVKYESGFGVIWMIGWMFTIGFLQLVWWKALLALIVWPWYLGVAVRLIS
jgi:hypothetical protein